MSVAPYSGNLVVTVPLKYNEIVKRMLDKEFGLKVEDRSYRLKQYPQCFVCSQAVDWILNYYQFKMDKKITREEATLVGEELRSANIFAHVIDSHKFKDEFLFFRFQVSLKSKFEQKKELNIEKKVEKLEEFPIKKEENKETAEEKKEVKIEEKKEEVEDEIDIKGVSVHQFKVLDIDKNLVDLSIYNGYVKLFVNVASFWGLTKQNYTELVQLYEKHKNQKFVILGFPCNQFGNQEPGTNQEIKDFVKKFNVEFPLFDKVDVNGKNADPLYKFLTNSISETALMITYNRILWNFAKFLVDKDGFPVKKIWI